MAITQITSARSWPTEDEGSEYDEEESFQCDEVIPRLSRAALVSSLSDRWTEDHLLKQTFANLPWRYTQTERKIWAEAKKHAFSRKVDVFWLEGKNADKATILVDEQHQKVVQIPTTWLITSKRLWKAAWVQDETVEYVPAPCIWLHSVKRDVFDRFYDWMHTGNLLRLHDKTSVASMYRILLDALRLGIYLECAEYQLATMREFLEYADRLDYPEVYVDEIWALTEDWAEHPGFSNLDPFEKKQVIHPMRKLIVAIVAEKTVGETKRDPILLHRSELCNGECTGKCRTGGKALIPSFWNMLKEYEVIYTLNGRNACPLPESVDVFVSGEVDRDIIHLLGECTLTD